jgi:hypothetical protein
VPVQAFVGESGGRAHSTKSTDHFVMTAVMFRDADHKRAIDLLAQLRRTYIGNLGRSCTG